MTEEQKSSKLKFLNILKPKNRNPASPVEGQHGNFSLTGMDTKQKEKPVSGSPRNKSTPSESSQSELTSSTNSTTTLDMSQSGETPQVIVIIEDYSTEPQKAGSSHSRKTSSSSSKFDSPWGSQTPPEKGKPNPTHKKMISSKKKKKSVEHPSSHCVPRGELSAQSELVEKCKALQHELEKVKNERDRANQCLEDERAKIDKFEEDRRTIINEKKEVKKENEKLKNEMFEIKSQINHHEAEKTHRKSTNPLLPECDEGSGHHSSPEQCRAELNGEVVMQRHNSFHHKEIELTVKALEDKTRHVDYNVEACVSPVGPQAELVTSREDLEKRLKEKEEEIDRLKQTITELRQSVQTQDIEKSDCHIASHGKSDEVKSLMKEVARLQNENRRQKKLLSATNDALRQLQEEKTSYQQQLQSLNEKLYRLQGEKKTANLNMLQLNLMCSHRKHRRQAMKNS